MPLNINFVHCIFGMIIYVTWTTWIICCTLGSLWTLDVIQYGNEDCIHPMNVKRSLPISLIVFSDLNALLLLFSLVIFLMEKASFYNGLFCAAMVTSIIQFGVNIILFIYIYDIHSMTTDSNDVDCEFDEDAIHISYLSYYYLLAALLIATLLLLITCTLALIMRYCKDTVTGLSAYVIEGDDAETRLIQHDQYTLQQTDFEEKESEEPTISNSFGKKAFRGKLSWQHYETIYDRNELAEMRKLNEFAPISFDAYFLLLEIKGLKATTNPLQNNQELVGNRVAFKVQLNDDEQQQNGYAVYNAKKNEINGVYRILFNKRLNDLDNLRQITFKIGNEASQKIEINNIENIIRVNDYNAAWKSNKKSEIQQNEDIIEAKVCRLKELKINLYIEKIRVYSSMRFPAEEECKIYSNHFSSDAECKEIQFEYGPNDMAILFEPERNMQIYYNECNNIVYGINNTTADVSSTHSGNGNYRNMARNKHSIYFEGLRYKPYYFENITQPFFMCCRYNFIKNTCLRGQDNEFNIMRSLCFLSAKTRERELKIWRGLTIGILVVILQLMLAAGVVIEVVKQWDVDEMFDDDRIIITISFLVLAFLSYLYWITVVKFYTFYECMYYVAEIDLSIIILDFISNIGIGFIVVVFAFNYLLLSESIADVVLNSFALTFIMELDDIANVFESDESNLLELDWNNCVVEPKSNDVVPPPWGNIADIDKHYSRDWDPKMVKRNINLNISKVIFKVVVAVILSPLFLLLATVELFQGIYYQAKIRSNKLNWTKNTRYRLSFI